MNLLTTLFNQFLPRICLFCKDRSDTAINLCEACQIDLPWLFNACMRCAMPMPLSVHNSAKICAQCIKKPPYFDSVSCAFHYQHAIRWLIKKLKFRQKLQYTSVLTHLMAQRIEKTYLTSQDLPKCIIPVPLHSLRIKERGFNQALELAKPLAKYFALPINKDSCYRARPTETQSLIPATSRQKNVSGAFSVNYLPAKHVALVDDVMTTGHTLNELSKTLRAAGVEKIDVWCVARTVISATNHSA